jgi:hypothetical protein
MDLPTNVGKNGSALRVWSINPTGERFSPAVGAESTSDEHTDSSKLTKCTTFSEIRNHEGSVEDVTLGVSAQGNLARQYPLISALLQQRL